MRNNCDVRKNTPLKISMIGHKKVPSREGGVEIVVEELARGLVKKGYDVTAYNRKGNHIAGEQYNLCNKEIEEYEGIKLTEVFTIEKKGLAAVTSSFFATLKSVWEKHDVIHFHAEGPCAMLWIPKIFGIKTVATIHGLDWQRAKWGGFAAKYIKFGEWVAAKYADEVIVLSENVQEYFKEKYNRETRFISNGIRKNEKKNPSVIKKKWGLDEDEYILFLGRIVPEKGLEYLVDAFKKVKTSKKLVIAGGASDTNEFMDKIKAKSLKDNRIIFTGFVQGKELEELYSNAYIYTLPSDLEGMPISLLEAMSYGNCCLVSDIPECLEVVENKGISFKKSDKDDLSKKLQWLCDNEEITYGYKEAASDFIHEKYSWEDVVEKTIETYNIN